MSVETVRDIIISILGVLSIIVLIGLLVVMFVVYSKTRKLVHKTDQVVYRVHRWLAYVQGMAKGFNESVNYIRKGG